jgi:hypothetical protein
MELLPPTDDALSEFVHQEPFRLARTLPLIATRFTPPRTPGYCSRAIVCCSGWTPRSPAR